MEWKYDPTCLTPEQTIVQQEEYAILRAYLADLPQLQQKILHLRFAAGLQCKEIALLLGRPEGTVRSHLLLIGLSY